MKCMDSLHSKAAGHKKEKEALAKRLEALREELEANKVAKAKLESLENISPAWSKRREETSRTEMGKRQGAWSKKG